MAPRTRNMQKCIDREKNQEDNAEGEPVPPLQPQEPVETNEEVCVEAENPNVVQASAIGDDGGGEVGEEEKDEEEKDEEEKEEEADVGENETGPESHENEVNEEPIDPRIENETEGNASDDEGSSRSSSRTVSEGPVSEPIDSPIDRQMESEDEEEEIEALQPLGMYFPPTEYTKKKKISTRCYINQVMKTFKELEHPLNTREKKWFEEHPQFKHIFHMPEDDNHKVMGIWLLLLRTACIDRKKEAWFVVNGVPIRYGIKEHALISGLNCKNYPLGYKEKGSLRFVRKYISRPVIRLQDVKEALEDMVPSRKGNDDRLKMLVLYFLASIIRGQTKCGNDATGVEEVLLRAVEDLTYCKTFPWGRLSFDHMLMEIAHTMRHFGGKVNKGRGPWPIPGFCLPLELLAFEAIPQLNSAFREVNPDADSSCPRMCKSKFRKSYLKGFPLSEINEQLGDTKDIDSIISVREEEHDLMSKIYEEEDVDDVQDYIVNTWMGRLSSGKTVFFQDMYDQDVASRVEEANENAGNEEVGEMGGLVDVVNAMRTEMDEKLTTIEEKFEEKFGGLAERITALEDYVKKGKARKGMLVGDDDDSPPISPQGRDDNPRTPPEADDEANLGEILSQRRSEIRSKKRSRLPGSYPRRPVTRSRVG